MICKSLADYLIYSAHFSKHLHTKFILFSWACTLLKFILSTGGGSAPAWSLFGGDREKTKEYNGKMKNGDEKWNSVRYDYQHIRYIYKNASAWWLLLD